ncbi:MAG: HEAT repeat domain-containing protein [Verrucomicrobiales bacterium]|nr:HEAT repeat domain-containing protein [Verrucomicrobiales bacterium]
MVLATCAGVLGATFAYAWLLQAREPVLAGRQLSAWRAELQTNYKGSLTLDLELQRAGSDALPFLVAAASSAPPFHQRLYWQAWRSGLSRMPMAVRRHLYPPRLIMSPGETLRQVAFTHLVALGPAAAPALPALIDLLRDGDELAASRVVELFANLGHAAKPAVPALIGARARFGPDFMLITVQALTKIAPTDANVVTVFAATLQDDVRAALVAARSLQSNGLEAHRVVPALTAVLKLDASSASEAAALLAEYGDGAVSAVPNLIEMLQRPSERLRIQAATTLGKIGRTAAAAKSALRDALNDDHIKVREAAAAALKNVSGDEG